MFGISVLAVRRAAISEKLISASGIVSRGCDDGSSAGIYDTE